MSPEARTLRMLIVDDEPFMLKLLRQMLVRLGHGQVGVCDSGDQALALLSCADAPIDLLFLDVNMPGMDGVEFIRRLGESGFAGSIVLVSGETSRLLDSVERLIAARQLHCLGSLQKPVALEQLRTLIERLERNIGEAPRMRAARQQPSPEQLQDAIGADQLVNHYQPQVALTTGEVLGVETLVRWQIPGGGLVYPDQFLAVAEHHGLIGVITRTVMVEAMKQARAWRVAGLDLNVAINVSMSDLTVLDFPDEAAAMAEYAGVDARRITLEVTEGQVMRQLSTVLDVLTRLHLKRFRLSIDDFGTGHSSLAQLRDLPFDELKIDRGFVHHAAEQATLHAICSASLRMAQQLQMPAVAEGIETLADWQLLRAMGCEMGQGYLIAAPMPGKDVPGWIDTWNERRGELLQKQA